MPSTRKCTRCGALFRNVRIKRARQFCSRHCANQRPLDLAANTKRIGACLVWTGYCDKGGYARFATKLVHRLVWIAAHGPIPKSTVVRHRCNNPPCVALRHLRAGTHADNVRDRVRAGRTARGNNHGFRKHPERAPRGSRNAAAKLTETSVAQILSSSADATTLAHKFNVSRGAIWLIKKRKTWKHVAQ